MTTTAAAQPTDRTTGLAGASPPSNEPQLTGRSSGVNIEPGSNDDGWIVPPPVKLCCGANIQLFKDGEAWHAAFEAMRAAKFRICLEVYIFASDETGRAAADLLCEKAKEGVRVYVIYDGFGSIDTDRTMFEKMRRSGVSLQEFNPIRPWECRFSWRPLNRDHRKLLIIDNDIGGLGGLNLGSQYAGPWVVASKLVGRKTKAKMTKPDLWRDNAIGITGPAVHHLRRAFARSWNYTLHGGRVRRAELIHNIYDGEFGLLASVPTLNSPLQPLLCKLLRSAKKSIYLTMAYFAPDDVLIEELCKAADRGARVRLMVPGRGDVKLLVIAARSFYELLMSHGVEIYERQNIVLHAKTMVVDGETTVIGSTNLDYRSIEYNCELSAIVRSPDFGQQVQTLFESDVRFSKRIDPEAWRRRPYWDRIGQWAVSRARYLL